MLTHAKLTKKNKPVTQLIFPLVEIDAYFLEVDFLMLFANAIALSMYALS